MMHRMPWLLGLTVALAVIGVDQSTKVAVSKSLSLYESVQVVGQVVRITHTRNPGIAFGLSLGALNGVVLTAVTLCGVIAILAYLIRQHNGSVGRSILIGLVLGGAVGNFIDRLRLGQVIDFLDVGVSGYRWPVFNVADGAVVIGVVLLLVRTRSVTPGDVPGRG